MKISTVLTYSTLDFKFLKKNLELLSNYSDEILLSFCKHFWEGEPEDEVLLKKSLEIASSFPKVKLVEYTYEGDKSNPHYYGVLSRQIGQQHASNEWVLYLDTDEFLSEEFYPWVNNYILSHPHVEGFMFSCYWYFRDVKYRAKQQDVAGLLIKNQSHTWDVEREDRWQFRYHPNLVVCEGNPNPFMHHFSWVRTKEQMLSKVKNWGHKTDKPWNHLIEEEFSRPFNGTDFVHNWSYDILEQNPFNL